MEFGKNVYVGNKQATKIMLGSTLVWELEKTVINNIIYYTTAGNVKYTDLPTTGWGANITSHSYISSNGRGVIEFDNDVTTIPYSAFGWISNTKTLTNINIPSSVTTIGSSAFMGSDFESIIIPENVTSIGHRTLYGCKNLKEVYFKSTVPPTLTHETLILKSNGYEAPTYYSDLTIYCPVGCRDLYRKAPYYYSSVYTIVEYDYDANPV